MTAEPARRANQLLPTGIRPTSFPKIRPTTINTPVWQNPDFHAIIRKAADRARRIIPTSRIIVRPKHIAFDLTIGRNLLVNQGLSFVLGLLFGRKLGGTINNPSRKDDSAKPELAWHRHPLVSSSFTILFGTLMVGLVVFWIQQNHMRNRALQEKRFAIAEEVVTFTAHASSSLSTVSMYVKGVRHRPAPRKREDVHTEEVKIQEIMNDVDRHAMKVTFAIAMYFGSQEALESFHSLRHEYTEAMDLLMKSVGQSPAKIDGLIDPYHLRLMQKAGTVMNAMRKQLPIMHIQVQSDRQEAKSRP